MSFAVFRRKATNQNGYNSPSFWDDLSVRYDEERNDTTYQSCLYACCRNIVLSRDESVVMELGCGTGMVTVSVARRYRAKRIVAIDFSPESLRRLKHKVCSEGLTNVAVVCADVKHLPVKPGVADLVICANLLQHFPADQQAAIMAELTTILKPMKTIVCSVHQYDTLKQRAGWHKVSYSFKGQNLYTFRFTIPEVKQLLLNNGFVPVKILGIGHTMPIWLLRLRQYRIWLLIDWLILNNIAAFAQSGHMLLAIGRKR